MMAAGSSRLPFVYISGEEVRRLVGMAELIEEMARGLQSVSAGAEGGVVQPVRSVVRVDKYSGNLGLMPAYSSQSDSLGVKLVTFYSQQVEGVPSHQAIVILLDPQTGSLLAILDGVEITAMRTAAASACALRALVTQPPRILCIVGSGVQARSHVQALKVNHSFSEIRVWGRSAASAQSCADELGAKVSLSLQDAVKDADVVVTVTLATEPLVYGKWLKPGAVIISVGACRPDWRELDNDVMVNSLVTVDTREGAMKESGDIIQSGVEIYAEIGDVISGTKPLPTLSDCGKKFLMFKSLGMAVEDVLAGNLIYHRFTETQRHTT